MGAEDVDLTETVEKPAHLLVGDLAFRLQRCGGTAPDETKAEPLYLPGLPVHVLITGRKGTLERPRPIDIAMDHVPVPSFEGGGHTRRTVRRLPPRWRP